MFIHNYDDIITIEKILQAWQEFLRDKKKRNDVIIFQSKLMDNIYSLHNDLKDKIYKHGGYVAFNISDPKPRIIHKASVRDRLLHHLIYQELYSYFNSKFTHDSYSCRIRKGTHKAIYRFEKFERIIGKNNTKTCWVLKCDIKKFFANIDHDILKGILKKHIKDKNILWLLGKVIDSFHSNTHISDSVYVQNVVITARQDLVESISTMVDMEYSLGKTSGVGLPLGNLTSQLLVNIYMNEFDQFVKRELKVKSYTRYADDFVVLSQDKKYLEGILDKMKEFLENNLKLTMHPDKVFIKTIFSGVDFLGWVQFSKHRVLRTATKKRMFRNLEKNRKPNTLASYLGMLKHGNTYKIKKSPKMV